MDESQPKPKGIDLDTAYKVLLNAYIRSEREKEAAAPPPTEEASKAPEVEKRDMNAIKAAIKASYQLMNVDQATWAIFIDQLTPSVRSTLAGLTDDLQQQEEALSAIRLSITATVAQIVKMKPADAGE